MSTETFKAVDKVFRETYERTYTPGEHLAAQNAALAAVIEHLTPSLAGSDKRAMSEVRPDLGAPTREPSLREILINHYQPWFSHHKSVELADRYIAALLATHPAGQSAGSGAETPRGVIGPIPRPTKDQRDYLDGLPTEAKCPEVITLTRTQYNEHYYSGYADGMKDGQGICEAALAARSAAPEAQSS